MAFFVPVCGSQYRSMAVTAASQLLQSVGFGSPGGAWLPLGIGVHAGLAFAGKVGAEGVHDFTVLGDTVNTAARLQAEAKAGEVVLSEAIFQDVADEYPDLERRTLTLKGKAEPVAVRVLRMG